MPRTHDDSWDLASSVGATATMVATSRAMASRGPEPLLDDPFAEPLVRAVGLDIHQPTAWSAEGLLPYLPADAQDRLFDSITALSAPGSRLATEHVPDPNAFTDERLQQISDRWRSFGFDLNAADLFYVGERSIVVDYLAGHGWQVDAHPAKELFARNGFEFPEQQAMAVFGEMSYVDATLKKKGKD